MRPDWQAAIVGLVLIVALLGVGALLGVAAARWEPEAHVSPYVIERDVVRCASGVVLAVSADGDGRVIAWCEAEGVSR